MPVKAKQLAGAQRRADHAHHSKRVLWLESPRPVWSCGSLVSAHDRQSLLQQSQAYLANPAGGFNHCHCQPRCA